MKPSEIIKKLRKESGLTQMDMSTVLKMSRPNYGQKENGNTAFTADEFFDALDYLKNSTPADVYNKATGTLFNVNPAPYFIEPEEMLDRVLGKFATPIGNDLRKVLLFLTKDQIEKNSQRAIEQVEINMTSIVKFHLSWDPIEDPED